MLLSEEAIFIPLEVLLQSIYVNYLINSYCLTVISDSSLNFNFQTGFLYINYNETDNLMDQLLYASEIGCSDYIIHINNVERLMKAFDSVSRIGNTRRSDRKIIFLPSNESSNESFLNIFFMKEAKFVPNIVIVLRTNPLKLSEGCEVFDLVTHNYVGSEDVANQPLHLDQWNSCKANFVKNRNLFPHDMSNLHGKSLKVGSITYKPYTILDLSPEKDPLLRDGTEIRMIDEFCRWINCTVELVRDDVNQWGVIFDNGTGNGIMGNIVEDRADLGIGALYSWYNSFIFMDFSTSTIRTSVTCIAPVPRLINSWDVPLLPFTWLVWVAVILTFIFAVVAFSITQGSTDGAVISIFGILITQSQNNIESSWRIRRVSLWLLLAGLVLNNAYGAGLAATFTIPRYEPSIDTIQDLIDQNIQWGTTSDAWLFSISLSSDPKLQQLMRQFRAYSPEELKRKLFDRSLAYGIEKLPSGYFAIGDYITEEGVPNLMIMLEDFYYEQCVVMLRKSSPYTQKLNQLIGRLHQSGLLLFWETQVVMEHVNFKIQLEVKSSRSKTDVPIVALTFHHTMGVFSIFLVGVILSTLLFLGELYFARRQVTTIFRCILNKETLINIQF